MGILLFELDGKAAQIAAKNALGKFDGDIVAIVGDSSYQNSRGTFGHLQDLRFKGRDQDWLQHIVSTNRPVVEGAVHELVEGVAGLIKAHEVRETIQRKVRGID